MENTCKLYSVFRQIVVYFLYKYDFDVKYINLYKK